MAPPTSIFVKQLGAKPVESIEEHMRDCTAPDLCPISLGQTLGPVRLLLRDRKGGDMAEWPADLRIREFPLTLSGVRSDTGPMRP